MRSVRTAFVAGAYYAALVGATSLGERILNQITLELRGDFAPMPATTRVARKKSFDDWKLMIRILIEWGVLPPDAAERFRRLHRLRNDAVHYNVPALDRASRDEALGAVRLNQEIIAQLFHPDKSQLIPSTPGVSFLRLDVESLPFVRRFFIPACALVSPVHEWGGENRVSILDDLDYKDPEGVTALNDKQFAARFATKL